MVKLMQNKMFTLSNGVVMPALGMGTWQIPNDQVAGPVEAALEIGYRHIDTAAAYGNEQGVGQAIRNALAKGTAARPDIFVTTKLMAETKGYEAAHRAFNASLDALGLDYVDLYLIHAPWPWEDMTGDYTQGNVASYQAMEEIYRSGRAKAIGVSNFLPEHLQPLIDRCQIMPMVNQISYQIGHTQRGTVDFCRSHGILIEAYAPLGTGRMLKKAEIIHMASHYGMSAAQLCIRYCLQKDTVTIPKSIHRERLAENFEVDFEITRQDMIRLDAMDKA